MTSSIAKYREEGHPRRWWLTDFTMEQVEGRLSDLERQNEELRREIEAGKKALGGFAGPPFDGSIECGVNAISMRCAAVERELAALRKKP